MSCLFLVDSQGRLLSCQDCRDKTHSGLRMKAVKVADHCLTEGNKKSGEGKKCDKEGGGKKETTADESRVGTLGSEHRRKC